MGYIKAYDVLPAEMIEQLQEYIEGEMMYVPKRNEHKKSWGETTDTRKYLDKRNLNIFKDYCEGMTVSQLAEKYFLVEKSIRRIIRQKRDIEKE